MMDPAKLAALKRHCHVDHNDDDLLLQSLYDAAVLYLLRAGVPAPEQSAADAEYDLCAFSLVNDWYDGTSVYQTCTVGLRELINQLKFSAVADSGEF